MPARPKERHRIGRIGWLRAAVLGANDRILSTASLVLGVATAHAILVAGALVWSLGQCAAAPHGVRSMGSTVHLRR